MAAPCEITDPDVTLGDRLGELPESSSDSSACCWGRGSIQGHVHLISLGTWLGTSGEAGKRCAIEKSRGTAEAF